MLPIKSPGGVVPDGGLVRAEMLAPFYDTAGDTALDADAEAGVEAEDETLEHDDSNVAATIVGAGTVATDAADIAAGSSTLASSSKEVGVVTDVGGSEVLANSSDNLLKTHPVAFGIALCLWHLDELPRNQENTQAIKNEMKIETHSSPACCPQSHPKEGASTCFEGNFRTRFRAYCPSDST